MIWYMGQEHEEEHDVHAFRVHGLDEQDPFNDLPESFWDEYTDIEHEFGVHDYGGGEFRDESVEGFGSYEIEPSDWPTVLQRYKDLFTKLGYTVSDLSEEEMTEFRKEWS